MDLGRNGYVKQINLYLTNKEHQQAYNLAKEFASKFPQDFLAHFFLAKAAYWTDNYNETAIEGRKAYNSASNPGDMLACGMIAAAGYYGLREYQKGYEFLKTLQETNSDKDLEGLLYSFSLAMDDEKKAVEHLTNIYMINPKSAEEIFRS